MKILNRPVTSSLVYYNANSRNNYVGDCVKRSISFALSMDYDEVGKELNKIKRDLGYQQWNIGPVFKKFLSDRGYHFEKAEPGITVDDFCDTHPEGTYLLETGPEKLAKQGRSNHILCVMDGDVYDSWDSTEESVTTVCTITESTSGTTDNDRIEIATEVRDYVADYLDKMQSRSELENLSIEYLVEEKGYYSDEYTVKFMLYGKTPDNIPSEANIKSDFLFRKIFTAKVSPRLSQEDNISKLKVKIKQRVYDWIHDIDKRIKDAKKLDELPFHPDFHGWDEEKMLLAKLPDWAVPRIYEVQINNGYGYKYQVFMDALPGDPRLKDNLKNLREVAFYADSLRELKDQINSYKENYSRYQYDY